MAIGSGFSEEKILKYLTELNLAKGKKVKNSTAKAPRGHTLLEGIVYGDIWQLDLTAGEEPGINVEEARSQQYCKVGGLTVCELAVT